MAMSTTDKLAQEVDGILKVMDDSWGIAAIKLRFYIAELKAANATPAGEVTADAVDVACAFRDWCELREAQKDKEIAALSAENARLAKDVATSGNYVCDKEVCPTSVTFTNGRIVRVAHCADNGYYLEIEHA
jgi:hypothetical protein